MQPRSFVTLALLAVALFGCSKPAPSDIADRLWVSTMPGAPRDVVDAFIVTEIKDRAFGSFYHGSLYRGSHDSFLWRTTGKDRAEIELLQDGRVKAIRIGTCTPDKGFDRCVRLEGDPKGVVRYQSKRRWAVPRRGKKSDVDVTQVIAELAEEDEELEALLELPPE